MKKYWAIFGTVSFLCSLFSLLGEVSAEIFGTIYAFMFLTYGTILFTVTIAKILTVLAFKQKLIIAQKEIVTQPKLEVKKEKWIN